MALTTNKGQELSREDIEKAIEQVLQPLEGFPLINCIGILTEAKSILEHRCYYQHPN